MDQLTKISFILLSCIAISVFAQNSTYCNSPYKEICSSKGVPHIACNTFWTTQAVTYSDRKVIDISVWKTAILRKHNEYRNSLAAGTVGDLPQAANLCVVVSIFLKNRKIF